MQYALLIYVNEAEYERRSAEIEKKTTTEYMQLNADLNAAGKLRASERLESVSTATTVRVKDGKVLKTDGPFAETREQLGGFYIVEAKDLDEAVSIAARIPGSHHGSVEVRPIWKVAKG